MHKICVIGFGCAGFNAVKAIRECGCNDEIHVFSDNILPPANPMLTTYFAAGKLEFADMFPFGSLDEISSKYNIEIHTDTKVKAIDDIDKKVILCNGNSMSFDKMLIATGATPIELPMQDSVKNRVYYMRTVEDANRLRNTLETQKIRSAVVVGGSMVGIKVVELLYNKGINCILADSAIHLFPKAAFPEIASAIEDKLSEKGIRLKLGYYLKDFIASESGIKIKFSDESMMESEMLIICIGTKANTCIVKDTRIEVGQGIIVNECMETSVNDIYAAGDCCEGYNLQNGMHQIIGLWANAAYQGETAGCNIAGNVAKFGGNISHNITHFFDMDFISLGDIFNTADMRTFSNAKSGKYIKILTDNDQIKCINILNDYMISGIIKNHILSSFVEKNKPVSPVMKGLLKRHGLPDELINLIGEKSYE